MTREETLELRAGGLRHIAIVLDQTRSPASSPPRAY
jgi:hypothetical protein